MSSVSCKRLGMAARREVATLVLVCMMIGLSMAWSQENGRAAPASIKDITAIWMGTLEAPGESIRVVFNISRNEHGLLTATVDSPDRGTKDIPVSHINWQDGALRLEVPSRGATFNGVLSQDGKELTGRWQQSGRTLPLKLRQVVQAPEIRVGLGIYVAATLTSFLAILFIGGFILAVTPRDEWRFVIGVAAVHLPMPAIAWGLPSVVFANLGLLYAPLIEEPSKLWLLLVPVFARRLTKENAPRAGMAIGLGFGIGEAWFVASAISSDPGIAGVPWYMFGTLGGYITERFMTCIVHGVFTAAALRTIRQAPVRSILFAMALHLVSNLPLALHDWNFGGLGDATWSVVVPVWMILYFFAMIALLSRFLKSADPDRFRRVLVGKAKCPGCGLIYERGWFGVNMGIRHRYERCPGCKKWHLTATWKEEGW